MNGKALAYLALLPFKLLFLLCFFAYQPRVNGGSLLKIYMQLKVAARVQPRRPTLKKHR